MSRCLRHATWSVSIHAHQWVKRAKNSIRKSKQKGQAEEGLKNSRIGANLRALA